MPAILTPEAAEIWLEPEPGELPALLSLLRPYSGELSLHPVSPLVNRADVDEAACVQPVDAPDLAARSRSVRGQPRRLTPSTPALPRIRP